MTAGDLAFVSGMEAFTHPSISLILISKITTGKKAGAWVIVMDITGKKMHGIIIPHSRW